MNNLASVSLFLSLLLACTSRLSADGSVEVNRERARTSFQSADPYDPRYDIRTDVAIVYGVDDTLTSRIAEWKRHGYRTEVMTGVAWGEYEAYIDGTFDGTNHVDEGQVDPKGEIIWHHPGVPYMVPTPSYVKFLCSLSRRAVDAGAEALHLEEPEFWARAGYSGGFKRLWQQEYSEPWQRPDSSPDAFWRSSKLKYLLYKRTLQEVFNDAREYAGSKQRQLQCYVPTHSLVNYAQWGIVSPESSLMDLPNCDGYIAQVWTGTARTPNRYHGVLKERTFETAFLEFASMHAMTAPTGRRVYFLADPVEDDPAHTWDDYRSNYEKVVVASLLFPDVHYFEVMPWPSRVFTHTYPAGTYASDAGTSRITIPPSYASELMTVVNALADMAQPDYEWNTDAHDVAVLMSDTMMFQRHSPWATGAAFDELFGLAMPLVKMGIPVRSVILERINDDAALNGISVVVMSYDHMKPLAPDQNQRLADWVKGGGILIYRGDDSDSFHRVREWWNKDGTTSDTARTDLFGRLGLAADSKEGKHEVGEGAVYFRRTGAALHARKAAPAAALISDLQTALQRKGRQIVPGNHLGLRRGPYYCGAVLDETSTTKPAALKGSFVNLFSADAEVLTDPEFAPGEVYLLRKIEDSYREPVLLATTARCEQTTSSGASREFLLRGPVETPGVVRLGAPEGSLVELDGSPAAAEWDDGGRTFRLKFRHSSEGTRLSVLPQI